MTNEPLETTEWLRRLKSDGTAALVGLFEFYRPSLREMIRLRIGGQLRARFDPSDVLQEVYVDAAGKIESYLQDPQVSAYVWLRGLTWDRLMKIQREHLGAQRRTAMRESPLPDDSSALLANQLLCGSLSPSQHCLKQEVRQRLQQAIERLSDEDHEVILMRHFEGMTNNQVAESLKISASGATMRHGRALARLKKQLILDLPQGESI